MRWKCLEPFSHHVLIQYIFTECPLCSRHFPWLLGYNGKQLIPEETQEIYSVKKRKLSKYALSVFQNFKGIASFWIIRVLVLMYICENKQTLGHDSIN